MEDHHSSPCAAHLHQPHRGDICGPQSVRDRLGTSSPRACSWASWYRRTGGHSGAWPVSARRPEGRAAVRLGHRDRDRAVLGDGWLGCDLAAAESGWNLSLSVAVSHQRRKRVCWILPSLSAPATGRCGAICSRRAAAARSRQVSAHAGRPSWRWSHIRPQSHDRRRHVGRMRLRHRRTGLLCRDGRMILFRRHSQPGPGQS